MVSNCGCLLCSQVTMRMMKKVIIMTMMMMLMAMMTMNHLLKSLTLFDYQTQWNPMTSLDLIEVD